MELGVVQYNQTSNNTNNRRISHPSTNPSSTYSSTTSFSNSSASATPTSCVPSMMATQTTTTTTLATPIGPTITNNHLRNPHHHEGDGKINPYYSSSSNTPADQNSPCCLLICLAFLFPPLAMAMLMKYHLKHPMDTSYKV